MTRRVNISLIAAAAALTLAATGLLGTASPFTARAGGRPSPGALQGAYLTNGRSDVDHHSFQAVTTFARGGVLSLIATDTPNAAFLGQWASRGDNGFVATFYEYNFDASGKLVSTGRVHVTGTFADARIHARYAATATDTHGNVTRDAGHFNGSRIDPT